MAQQMVMPLVMQDAYEKPYHSNDEEEARKKERGWPKVMVRMFVYTEQVPNQSGGKGESGNWLPRPQLHLYAGSKAAQGHLKDAINSTATRWATHAEWQDFAGVVFEDGRVNKLHDTPRTTLTHKNAKITNPKKKGNEKKVPAKRKKAPGSASRAPARKKIKQEVDSDDETTLDFSGGVESVAGRPRRGVTKGII
jgi:hypothetical protein